MKNRIFFASFLFCSVLCSCFSTKKSNEKLYGWTNFPYTNLVNANIKVDDLELNSQYLGKLEATSSIRYEDGVIIGDTGNYGYFSENDMNISTPQQVVLANAKYELIKQAIAIDAGFMTGFNYIYHYDKDTKTLTVTVYALAFSVDTKNPIKKDGISSTKTEEVKPLEVLNV